MWPRWLQCLLIVKTLKRSIFESKRPMTLCGPLFIYQDPQIWLHIGTIWRIWFLAIGRYWSSSCKLHVWVLLVILFSTFMTKYAACQKMSPDTWKICRIPEEGHFGLASQFASRQQLLQRTSKGYWMYFDHSYIALFNNCANRSCHLHI